MPQTKSKTRKLFKETTLFYGQPVGDRLDDLFDQYVQEPCTAEGAKRERDVLVITDGSPCKSGRGALPSRRSRNCSGRSRGCPGQNLQGSRRAGVA